MTTDLEKQFFDTFGIEPRQWYKISMGKKGNFYNEPSHKSYPQITDSILLSLVKIACKESIISLTKMKNNTKEWAIYFGLDKNCIFYEKSFKDVILRGFIEYSNDIDIYQKVQALFKEE